MLNTDLSEFSHVVLINLLDIQTRHQSSPAIQLGHVISIQVKFTIHSDDVTFDQFQFFFWVTCGTQAIRIIVKQDNEPFALSRISWSSLENIFDY